MSYNISKEPARENGSEGDKFNNGGTSDNTLFRNTINDNLLENEKTLTQNLENQSKSYIM